MATFHIVSSIDGLLNQKKSLLGRLFDMNGDEAIRQLKERKAKGHKYIPSDNCKHFDPVKGCLCGEYEELIN